MNKKFVISYGVFIFIFVFLYGCGNSTSIKKEIKTTAEDSLKLVRSYNDSGLSCARNEKNYIKAIQYFNKAIDVKPDFGVAFSNRGNAYRLLKEYDKALSDINKAFKLNPTDTLLHRIMAKIYVDSEQYEKAIEEFTKVIEMKMIDSVLRADLYKERGNTYLLLKEEDLAKKDFQQAHLFNKNS